MPELPEAETIVRGLRPRLEGHRILCAEFLTRRVSPHGAELLEGRRVEAVRRFGKKILFDLDRGLLLVDLRMTGRLLLEAQPGAYTRAILTLDNGTVLFDDVRQFGSLRWLERVPEDAGPDPLEIPAEEFAERLRARNMAVKRLLLDQSFVRGIGNIYADEALFRAGLHPAARTRRLGTARAARLHAAVVETLEESILHGGSSVSDYVGADGRRGSFQLLHRVYRKQGEPCTCCGGAIRRIVVAQRGTHFCPACQRRN